MTRFLVGHLSILALSAPWLFLFMGSETKVAGLPLWAVYTVAISAFYAVFVAVSYKIYWDRCASRRDHR